MDVSSAVMSASRVLVGLAAASVAQVEDTVTLPQLRVLVLAHADQPLTVGTVAQSLGVHASNASRTCERLVSLGLLHREDDPADRRQVRLTLTPAGRALVESVLDHRRAAIETVLAHMAPHDREALAQTLETFSDAARRASVDTSPALRWVT